MDQETDVMKRHIDDERNQLTGKLQEIESRFKNATDLRQRFDQNPLLGLGLAFAGGFLLSTVIGTAGSGSSAAEPHEIGRRPQRTVSPVSQLTGTVANIFQAFAGLASKKMESLIADAVPGFQEQYETVKGKRLAGTHAQAS